MQKISAWGLNFLLAGSLNGTLFFEEMLSQLSFKVDEEKNILDYQVDNIKTALKVALCFAIKEDSEIAPKFRQALISLLDFGTERSSNAIRAFLESEESKTPLIITEVPEGYSEIFISSFSLITGNLEDASPKLLGHWCSLKEDQLPFFIS